MNNICKYVKFLWNCFWFERIYYLDHLNKSLPGLLFWLVTVSRLRLCTPCLKKHNSHNNQVFVIEASKANRREP